jgi:hypothetical protein
VGCDKSKFDVNHDHKTRKDTDRTAHIIDNMVICRTFVRSVVTIILTRVGDISPASHR